MLLALIAPWNSPCATGARGETKSRSRMHHILRRRLPFSRRMKAARFSRSASLRRFAMSQEGQELLKPSTVATFPKSKDSPDSVTVIFTKFFTDMFASVKLGRMRPEKTTQNIAVEPSEFSLAERRELDATYTVRNNTKKLIRLDFNTTQRIDILTSDASGKVIEKWSEDRAFQFQEGIVIINPQGADRIFREGCHQRNEAFGDLHD